MKENVQPAGGYRQNRSCKGCMIKPAPPKHDLTAGSQRPLSPSGLLCPVGRAGWDLSTGPEARMSREEEGSLLMKKIHLKSRGLALGSPAPWDSHLFNCSSY